MGTRSYFWRNSHDWRWRCFLSGAAIKHLGLTGGRAPAAGIIAGGVDFGTGVAADHYLPGAPPSGIAVMANGGMMALAPRYETFLLTHIKLRLIYTDLDGSKTL